MDRVTFLFVVCFLIIASSNCNASILVKNDWVSATVQIRYQKGGAIQKTIVAEGAADIDISAVSNNGDTAQVEINQASCSDAMICARAATNDFSTEVEAWLLTSWIFSVIDGPVNYQINLFADEGGMFTSEFLLYDLTDGVAVKRDELYSYGHISGAGVLVAGHDYLFDAYLPRVDPDNQSDIVFDGISGLDFVVDTDVIYSPDRTHVRAYVIEPQSPLIFLMGLVGLLIQNRKKQQVRIL